MELSITPSHLHGVVDVPASKSIMHRALICAALAKGKSIIHNTYVSQDITATMDCLTQLGASFVVHEDTIEVHGIEQAAPAANLFCGESGSTIRFLIPIAAALDVNAAFSGTGKLVSRPLHLYRDAFIGKGVTFDYTGMLPANLSGQLKSGIYCIPGNVSSQFITGLLFALPILEGDSVLEVLPPFESKSYVDITLSCLRAFGIEVENEGSTYHIPGGQQYRATDYAVESDYSQAAFFLVANALGNDLTLRTFGEQSVQGDSAILRILSEAGVESHLQNGALTNTVQKLSAFHIEASDIPDLVPILCVLACFCDGVSTIQKVERLKIKESDRIASTMDIVTRLGGTIAYADDTITITGGMTHFQSAVLPSYNDHRIAMAGAIAATKANGDIIIEDAGCVRKSFPTFFETYQHLGGNCHVIHVDERN